jgi:hypothetical protein
VTEAFNCTTDAQHNEIDAAVQTTHIAEFAINKATRKAV